MTTRQTGSTTGMLKVSADGRDAVPAVPGARDAGPAGDAVDLPDAGGPTAADLALSDADVATASTAQARTGAAVGEDRS